MAVGFTPIERRETAGIKFTGFFGDNRESSVDLSVLVPARPLRRMRTAQYHQHGCQCHQYERRPNGLHLPGRLSRAGQRLLR
jgi:hypothetical protein